MSVTSLRSGIARASVSLAGRLLAWREPRVGLCMTADDLSLPVRQKSGSFPQPRYLTIGSVPGALRGALASAGLSLSLSPPLSLSYLSHCLSLLSLSHCLSPLSVSLSLSLSVSASVSISLITNMSRLSPFSLYLPPVSLTHSLTDVDQLHASEVVSGQSAALTATDRQTDRQAGR